MRVSRADEREVITVPGLCHLNKGLKVSKDTAFRAMERLWSESPGYSIFVVLL